MARKIAPPLQDDHVVAVNDFVASVMADAGLDLVRLGPGEAGDVAGAVAGEAAGELAALRVDEPDGVARVELTANAENTGGEQAAVPLGDGAGRPGVDEDRAVRLERVGD